MFTKPHILLFLLAILTVFAFRTLGPSDIHDKEQPRTTSYTADMLLNHHFIMPHDAAGEPATKPPLYNWISLPFVALAGYQEWALRSPSLLAAIAAFFIIAWFARWLFQQPIANSPPLSPSQATAAGYLAAIVWLVSFDNSRLLYLARPDMVLVACLTAAWAFATRTLLEENPRRRKLFALALWLATALAALDKGPMALMPMLYIPFAAKSLAPSGKWSAANRTYWFLGFPFVLLCFAAWAYPAYLAEPQFFKKILLGQEVAKRMEVSSTFITDWWKVLQYTITPFVPWSLFALGSLVLIPRKNWFRGNLLAATFIWILLLMAAFSCIATKRADRFAPIYPASAIACAWVMIQIALRVKNFHWIPVTILLVALALAVFHLRYSDEAKTHYGDNVKAFAATVSQKVDGEPIAFYGVGQTPLETLLARHQDGDPSPQQLAQAKWIIRPLAPGETPLLTSAPIDQIESPYRKEPGALPLGLFPR